MIDELVGKVVRFGGDAYRHAVATSRLGERHEVGDGFADARSRLDHAMRAGREGIAHLARHLHLLGAGLVLGIHPVDQAARSIVRANLLGGRHREKRQVIGIDALLGSLRAKHLGAGGGEREDRIGILPRQEREDGAIAPRNVGVHIRQAAHQSPRQIAQRHQQDAPDAAQRLDIIDRPVRDGTAPEQFGQIRQLVRRQARKRDARQGKRIDPHVADANASLDRLDERAVERGVMRDNGATADKILEQGDRLLRRRRVSDIGIRNARQTDDLVGNRNARMHEGVEPVDDFPAPQTGRGDLDKPVVLHRKTRGLGIEDDHVLLDQAERTRLCALG